MKISFGHIAGATLPLLFLLSIALTEAGPLEPTNVPVFFGEVPKTSEAAIEFSVGEDALREEHIGERVTLFGQLHDTSAINLFHGFSYNGRRINRRRYYVKERIYERPHKSIWATVEASVSRVDSRNGDKHEIQIHSYQGLSTEEMQAVARASVASSEWVSKHRGTIDLNKFKEVNLKPSFVTEANWNRDFNQLEQRNDLEIHSLDIKRSIIELVCSRYVVEEVAHHHAVFVELIMVYNLSDCKPIRLLVRRGGYFLE